MNELLRELKVLVVEALHLEDLSPDDIGDDTPLFADDGLDVQFLAQLARQSRWRALARLDLPAGKFPLQRMPATALTLPDQDFPSPHHDGRNHFYHGC